MAGMDSPDEELRHYLNELMQSIRALPASGLPRGRLGMAFEANGFLAPALASYDQAAMLAPEDFRWPYFGALLAGREGRFQEALDRLESALAIDADYAPAWLWRGDWLLQLGRSEAARNAFRQAETLGAETQAAFGLALVDIALERFADAVARLEPLAAESRSARIQRALGQAHRALGNVKAARRALARGRAPGPLEWDDPRQEQKMSHARGYASFDHAQALSSGGRARQAIPIFERLRQWHPDERCADDDGHFFTCNLLNSLGIAHARAGRLAPAIEIARQGLTLRPDFAPFHVSLASHYREQRNWAQALHHIDRAIALNPASGHAHAQRGRLLFAEGRQADAKSAFETALGLEPEATTTLFYLGTVEAALENWPQAIGHFQRAVELDPDLALGHLYLARALGEDKRLDEAREALEEARAFGVPAAEINATNRRLREFASSASSVP